MHSSALPILPALLAPGLWPHVCGFKAQHLRLVIAMNLVVGMASGRWGWASSPAAVLHQGSCSRCCTGTTGPVEEAPHCRLAGSWAKSWGWPA